MVVTLRIVSSFLAFGVFMQFIFLIKNEITIKNLRNTREVLEQANTQKELRINEMRKDLDICEKNHLRVTREILAAEAEVSKLTGECQKLKDELEAKKIELAAVTDQLRQLVSRNNQHFDRLTRADEANKELLRTCESLTTEAEKRRVECEDLFYQISLLKEANAAKDARLEESAKKIQQLSAFIARTHDSVASAVSSLGVLCDHICSLDLPDDEQDTVLSQSHVELPASPPEVPYDF